MTARRPTIRPELTCSTAPTWKIRHDGASALLSVYRLDGRLVIDLWAETDDVLVRANVEHRSDSSPGHGLRDYEKRS